MKAIDLLVETIGKDDPEIILISGLQVGELGGSSAHGISGSHGILRRTGERNSRLCLCSAGIFAGGSELQQRQLPCALEDVGFPTKNIKLAYAQKIPSIYGFICNKFKKQVD